MILWFNTCWAQLGSSSLGWIYSCVWGQVLGQSSAPGAEMAHFCSTQSPILHQVNSGLFSWRRQGSLKTAKACQGLLRPQLTRAGEIGLPLGWRCCKVAEGTAVRITSAVFEKKKKKKLPELLSRTVSTSLQCLTHNARSMTMLSLHNPFSHHFESNSNSHKYSRLLLSRKTQTVRYFSSKDGFIQDQQRIAIWDLQPWWAISHYRPVRKGESFWRWKKKLNGLE